MIVADANLIAYFVWPGPRSAESDAVWARDPVWVAPPLWLSELRNALSLGVRRGTHSVDAAVAAVARAVAVVEPAEPGISTRAVLELAERSGCTAYDCEYVALATDLGARLVTSDRAILRAFPKVAVGPREFAA
jgi:predicted nucleic acid-binding protein